MVNDKTMIRKSDEIMFGVTERKLKELRETYKKGMTIQLDYMDDPQATEKQLAVNSIPEP